jgi:Na+/proline symporter
MTDRVLIVGFSAALIAVSFVIGLWARRRMNSAQAYFGATGLFGPLTISLSSMAAVASAFALVGVPGLIYLSGNTIVLWMLGSPAFALGYMMLGKKVRAMAEVAPVATLGDVSDLRFNNHRGIKALVSIILLLGCVAYLASQIKAGADLFAHLLGWSPWTAALVIFGILAAYTVISGEVGGFLTQAFQGLVMVVAFMVVTVGMGALYLVASGKVAPLASPDRAIFVFADFAGLVVSLVLNLVCLVLDKVVGFQWPGGMPWYLVTVGATAVVTIVVSLVTSGATGDELDPRVEAVIDL